MGDCHPTRALRDEHTLILQVIDALERLLDRGRIAVSAGEIRDFVDFFRLYTDALHHGKEERVLFEAMAEHGFADATGPIAHMLEEHRLGRALVRQMADGEALDDDRCRQVCDAYEAVCASRFEGRTLEQLERAGQSLVVRYER